MFDASLFVLILVPIILFSVKTSAGTESEPLETMGRWRESAEYGVDYKLTAPGDPPVSNFYSQPFFQIVNPECYFGAITYRAESQIPVGLTSKVYQHEVIELSGTQNEGFVNPHKWDVTSDPFRVIGVSSEGEGRGEGVARVRLGVNLEYGLFRIVTDVRPRSGTYKISTTGSGISRVKQEDMYFAFADHHYSYISSDLPEDFVEFLLSPSSGPPPNVYVGNLEYGGRRGLVASLEYEKSGSFSSVGAKGTIDAAVEIRIECEDINRQFNRLHEYPE